MAKGPEITGLNLEQARLLTKARVLGPGTALPVLLSDEELTRLISVILADTDHKSMIPTTAKLPEGGSWDYYALPLDWFDCDEKEPKFLEFYVQCVNKIRDFETYFKCLCELHKRRKKYERILSAQPLPTMLQVAPRALLEFGAVATPALASWLTWRKWFYDIDNRSAQETGYLFEPILANALGGVSYGARNSPIKRRSDGRKGRQVDCVVDHDAYEFKLRVTIAASGQGRFGEELDFAEDCRVSGFRPVLLVLDPTPSHRLDDLSREFERVGGSAFVGDAAWKHIETRSGPTMATFVEKYVRRPIQQLDEHSTKLLDLAISSSCDNREFKVRLSDAKDAYEWPITRAEIGELSEDDGTEAD
jgi:hypothetical protein